MHSSEFIDFGDDAAKTEGRRKWYKPRETILMKSQRGRKGRLVTLVRVAESISSLRLSQLTEIAYSPHNPVESR
jgi:hypothetical protein